MPRGIRLVRGGFRRRTPAKLSPTFNREELAWAAGFVDGEGSFFRTVANKAAGQIIATLSVTQVNRRMLVRLRRAIGFGRINGPFKHSTKPNANPLYYYRVRGFHTTQAALALLWTWLGPVKRKQAKSVLLKELR